MTVWLPGGGGQAGRRPHWRPARRARVRNHPQDQAPVRNRRWISCGSGWMLRSRAGWGRCAWRASTAR